MMNATLHAKLGAQSQMFLSFRPRRLLIHKEKPWHADHNTTAKLDFTINAPFPDYLFVNADSFAHGTQVSARQKCSNEDTQEPPIQCKQTSKRRKFHARSGLVDLGIHHSVEAMIAALAIVNPVLLYAALKRLV
jgi:hypothetical protein